MDDADPRSGHAPADAARDHGPGPSEMDVRVLRPVDAGAATAALIRGFGEEPAKVALVPDPRLRRAWLEVSIRGRLQESLRHGTAHVAVVDARPAGVAAWLPPGAPKLSLRGVGRLLAGLASNAPDLGRSLPRMASVASSDVAGAVALARRRGPAVARASHGLSWRLDLVATVPEHRGRGVARPLLDRQLRRCDEDGAAAWLETTDPVNVPIYERFGFETVAHVDDLSWLPGYWVMRREPRTRPS